MEGFHFKLRFPFLFIDAVTNSGRDHYYLELLGKNTCLTFNYDGLGVLIRIHAYM